MTDPQSEALCCKSIYRWKREGRGMDHQGLGMLTESNHPTNLLRSSWPRGDTRTSLAVPGPRGPPRALGLPRVFLNSVYHMLLPPSPRSSCIFRVLSLLVARTLAGRQLGLNHPLPKSPELLEKLTFPSTVPVTQEKQPYAMPSGGQTSQCFATDTGHT